MIELDDISKNYVNELKKLEDEFNMLQSELAAYKDTYKKLCSLETLQERFRKFGEVFIYSDNYVLKLKLPHEKSVNIVLSSKSDKVERNWEYDDIKFSDIFKQVSFNASDVETLMDDINKTKSIIEDLVITSDEGRHKSENTYKQIQTFYNEIEDICHKQSGVYESFKNHILISKYDSNMLNVPRYLKDRRKKNVIGYVKIIKKEDSGLGYTVKDIESGETYYHISADRLEIDKRCIPSITELLCEIVKSTDD